MGYQDNYVGLRPGRSVEKLRSDSGMPSNLGTAQTGRGFRTSGAISPLWGNQVPKKTEAKAEDGAKALSTYYAPQMPSFNIPKAPGFGEQLAMNVGGKVVTGQIRAVRDRGDQRVALGQVTPLGEADAIFVLGFARLAERIVHMHVAAEGLQFANDVDHLGIAQVWAVLLESEAEHVDLGALHLHTVGDHFLHRFLCHVGTHAVVDTAPGEDDLRVVAEHVGLMGEIVRVDADAVAADQARAEGQEVPLGAGCLQHLEGVDAEPVKN